jgi:hypothetical protein
MDGWMLFKIDDKTAYDKVNWNFLQQAMRMKGFPPLWREWVACFVQVGSVGMRVNDDICNYFHILKGLHQGGPLSPMFFNIVAGMLAILIARGSGRGPSRWINTAPCGSGDVNASV